MAKGLKLDFSDKDGAALVVGTLSSGVDAVVQNAMVLLATAKGSDKMFKDKGTDLMKSATRGAMVSANSAAHVCNFAAVNTLFFSREHERDDEVDALSSVTLKPAEVSQGRLKVSASFKTVTDKVIGNQLTVQ